MCTPTQPRAVRAVNAGPVLQATRGDQRRGAGRGALAICPTCGRAGGPVGVLEPMPALTARQREIAALLVEGMPTHEIAEHLFLSESTIKHHLHSLYARLGVKTRIQAVVLLLTGDFDQHWFEGGTGLP